MPSKHCPKCDADLSDSYQAVGIMSSGYYCDACDLAIDADDEWHEDDVPSFSSIKDGFCQHCGMPLEAGYGLAGGGLGPYMYCPNEYCMKPTFIKSQENI